MKINALLDVNVVAHEAADEVTVLLELEAPASVADTARPPSSLQVVLDRSGSMAGAPLEGAKKALIALVQRLEPIDNFGLVTFDNTAQLVVAAGPLHDKAAVIAEIQRIDAGGSTDLGAGYLRGLRELRRVVQTTGAGGTLLVISDGHVNAGITDADEFASLASKAHSDRITTSTLGYGRGYDETLLSAVARSGSGNHVFAADPDAAGAAIAAEVEGLLDKVVQAATLTVKFEPTVQMLRLFNDLPAQQIADGTVMIELGDLYAAEERKVLLRMQVPALVALGLARVATLELQYVELPGLIEQRVSLPISVNVVPGDERGDRVPHPTVQSEVLFQEAQEAKRKASEAFESGDLDGGELFLAMAGGLIGGALAITPEGLADAVRSEQEEIDRMRMMTRHQDTSYMSKMTRDSFHQQNRKRGRRRPTSAPENPDENGAA
ncbi:MAG: VWA domain-containing protein [Propionibacteriales bacterium]|nr:VWA domain-containing protein [Propionibacteriales bacterium]